MTFELQPSLRGKCLELRPLQLDDFENLFDVAKDPLIWEQHPMWDRYKREVFQKFFAEAIASKGAFAVLDTATGKIIGSTRYYDLGENEVFIGYTFLARRYWGGKFNKEMKTLMVNHAFKFVETVKFHIGESNKRSQAAMAKLGGRFSYKIPRLDRSPTGQEICQLVYVMKKEANPLAEV